VTTHGRDPMVLGSVSPTPGRLGKGAQSGRTHPRWFPRANRIHFGERACRCWWSVRCPRAGDISD
jgi:hypothetical protein